MKLIKNKLNKFRDKNSIAFFIYIWCVFCDECVKWYLILNIKYRTIIIKKNNHQNGDI